MKVKLIPTSVSRSEEETEELVGDEGGGTNSVAGSNMLASLRAGNW